MYFVDVATAVASVHAFWLDCAPLIAGGAQLQVENFGDILDSTTGALTDTWTADPVAVVSAGGGGPYSAPSGLVIDWLTQTVAHKKRLRGKTFVVPITRDAYDSDGSLTSDVVTQMESYGGDLIATQSNSFVIWHRGTGTDGSTGLVTSCHVPDMAAILRSRRD